MLLIHIFVIDTFTIRVMPLHVRFQAYPLYGMLYLSEFSLQTKTTLRIPCINRYNKGNYRFKGNWKGEGVNVNEVTTNKPACHLSPERAEKRYYYAHLII